MPEDAVHSNAASTPFVEKKRSAPAKPNPLIAWFMRGNPIFKVGALILFLGLAFLLRYTANRIVIPIPLRYVCVSLAAIGALILGWVLQKRNREYGLSLQGLGMAVMYLITLAALKLHGLISSPFAFIIMLVLITVMIALALKQNALVLAQIAVLGGLAAPILTSAGSGQYLILFSYLALLNTGIAVIAWFKAWRSLNVIGFIGTLEIASVWGARSYAAEIFSGLHVSWFY